MNKRIKGQHLLCVPPPPTIGVLDSLQRGTIAEVFARTILHFVPPKDRPLVLDLTHRVGDFWKHCGYWYRVVRMDLDLDGALRAGGHIDLVGDFREPLPFRDRTFGAVAFDPPYSLFGSNKGYAAKTYTAMYRSFGEMRFRQSAREWARILRDDGVLIARTQDAHRRGRYVPMSDILERDIAGSFVRTDEVIHEIGGFPPRFAMVPPPKTRKIHSFFQIYAKGAADGHPRVWDMEEPIDWEAVEPE